MSKPGWYELVGPPQCGKTVLACILARDYQSVIWISSPNGDPLPLWGTIGWYPEARISAETVQMAFETMRELQDCTDFIILDDLAGLLPMHPDATTVANDIERTLFEAKVPILVVNQERYPAPPGGTFWREMVKSRQLYLRNEKPLYAELQGSNLWLVWWPGEGPEFRELQQDEIQIFNPALPERCRAWLV